MLFLFVYCLTETMQFVQLQLTPYFLHFQSNLKCESYGALQLVVVG